MIINGRSSAKPLDAAETQALLDLALRAADTPTRTGAALLLEAPEIRSAAARLLYALPAARHQLAESLMRSLLQVNCRLTAREVTGFDDDGRQQTNYLPVLSGSGGERLDLENISAIDETGMPARLRQLMSFIGGDIQRLDALAEAGTTHFLPDLSVADEQWLMGLVDANNQLHEAAAALVYGGERDMAFGIINEDLLDQTPSAEIAAP